mgnify:CR=1 FL=1
MAQLDPDTGHRGPGPVGGEVPDLNPAQLDAVTHPTGPLLVVAGAIGRVQFPKALGNPYFRE